MELVNKSDGCRYIVTTDTGDIGEFSIFAVPLDEIGKAKEFCMSYTSLKDFCEDWEDCD